MRSIPFISALVLLPSFTFYLVSATSITRNSDIDVRKYYTRYHSLGDDYQFDPREWQSVNVTDLSYKYEKAPSPAKPNPNARARRSQGGIAQVLKEMKGLGPPEEVKITWYTGHDLQNPSCWAKPTWAPTDESFACALTLEGWNSQPKCFKFLELCNGPLKCVFVRVVDSCAGCAPGSKHVDLTKGAFSQLADPDEGVLNVQMRHATAPMTWFEDLWGPENN